MKKPFILLFLSVLVTLFIGPNKLLAQDNTGTEFWFTPFAPGEYYLNDLDLPGIYVVGNYDATVTLDYVARNPANDPSGDPQCTQYTFNLVGGVPQYVDIPYDLQVNCFRFLDDIHTALVETIQNNGIKCTSTAPIALYSQYLGQASSEMTPILPVTEMGTDYIATAYREITSVNNDFNARITIVAIEDNTDVTFTLPNYTWTSKFINTNCSLSRGPGSTWTVSNMMEGQTYTILCNDNNQALNATPNGSTVSITHNQGLNGVRISATKDISVMGGTDCTWAGNDEYIGCGACDLTATHLKPTTNWGTSYATAQTLVRPNQMAAITTLRTPQAPNIEPYPANNNVRSVADYLLITARDNGTAVNIGGKANYTKSLNAGEWFIYESPGNSNPSTPPPTTSPGSTQHVINSNNPIQVIQMMKGWQCDNINPADPSQMLVIERAKWDDNYILTNPTQYAQNFFAFIIEEANGTTNAARASLNLTAAGSNVPIPSGISPTGDGQGGWTKYGTTNFYFQRLDITAAGGGAAVRARSVPATPGGPTYDFAFYASGSTNASSYGYMGGAVCQLEATADVDTDTLCAGETQTLEMTGTTNGGTVLGQLNYTYTWTVQNSTGATEYSFTGTGATVDHTFNVTGSGLMTVILDVTDNAGCQAQATTQYFVNGVPDIDDIADYSACGTSNFPNITGSNLTGNQAYYTMANGGGTSYLPGVQVPASGTYYMYDDVSSTCFDEEDVTITLNTSPTVDPASIVRTCNTAGTNYTLSFTVSGGNGGPYTVTEIAPGGTGGSFSGNTWNSDPNNPIPSGTAYNFEVTDANGCPPAIVSGSFNCNCISDAGTMDITPIEICGDGQQTAPAGTVTPTTDSDDAISYVLHTSSGATLGTVIDEQLTASFSFNSATMTYGTTYYISRIVGNDLGTGFVDHTDICLSVSVGTPVTWNEEVTVVVNLGNDLEICLGDGSSLDFAITGPPNFNIQYSDGSSTMNILGVGSNHSESVSPTVTTTYTILDVQSLSSGCQTSFNGPNPSTTITVNDAPQSQNLTETCDPTNTQYVVSFDITNGDPSTYDVTVNAPVGLTGTLVGNTWTSDPIPSGTAYDFTLSDDNQCGTESITGLNTCVCVSDAGGMSMAEITTCGEGNVTANPDAGQPPFLDPNDVNGYILHDQSGTVLGNIYGISTTPTFAFNSGTMTFGVTYYISSAVGNDDGTGNVSVTDPCLDVSPGTPVIWLEQPEAVPSGNFPICSGQTLQLNGTTATGMTGVTYTWVGGAGFFSDVQNPIVNNASAGLNGPITLTVANGVCTDDSTFNAVVYQSATANFTPTLMGPSSEAHLYHFNNGSTGANGYLWDFGDTQTSTEQDPMHQYVEETGSANVSLIAYGENGCNDTLMINVSLLVIPENDTVLVWMPNSFTPDGNEYNQYLTPIFNESVDLTKYTMTVFNRWGEKVFISTDVEIGWDGTYQQMMAPDGIYTYVLEFSDKHTFKNYRKEGFVNLIK